MSLLLSLLLAACSAETAAIAPPGDGGGRPDAMADSTAADTGVPAPDSAPRDARMDGDGSTPPDAMPPADTGVDSGPPPRPTGPFGAPQLIRELSDPLAFDDDPTLSDDMLVIVFNSNRETAVHDLFMAERARIGERWETPRRLEEINSRFTDTTPGLSGDGLTLHFASNRPGGLGGYDIYRSTRASRRDRWSPPVRVDVLSSGAGDSAVSPILGETITAVVIEGAGFANIYESRRASPSAPWGAPAPLSPLNVATATDRSALLEASGLGLWFDSNRNGDFDIYIAVRPSLDAPFAAPREVTELNSLYTDTDPWISPDLRHVVFVSSRTGSHELYEASR